MPVPADYVYRPRGGAELAFCAKEPEVLICGAAGTGKSICMATRVDFMAAKYPGSRHLILRKTRASLTDSALVTFEAKVVREGSIINGGIGRINRHSYIYKNDSEIVAGGLDKPEKVMSTDYDSIYIQEATELNLDEYDHLLTRLRNNKMPYQIMLADCNPSYPDHWLKKRCDAGKMRYIQSTHQDNPMLWDAQKQSWTKEGIDYIARLDNLTGTTKDRLRFGKWCAAEGTVYEDSWLPNGGHIINPFPIPSEWPRYVSVDFGYASPFACLWGAVSPEGILYIYREWYKTKMTVADHANTIRNLSMGEPRPVAVICDHDPENRVDLERGTGWMTENATKGKVEMIQTVRDRLGNKARKGDKWEPTLQVFSNCLVEVDHDWSGKGNPCGLIAEMVTYTYGKSKANRSPRELPLDKDDHSCDCLGYLCTYLARNGKSGAMITDAHIIPNQTTNPALRPLIHSPLVPRYRS